MRLPAPVDRTTINDTDFSVLCCLLEDGPLWKMEVTRRLNERRETGPLVLDLQDRISKQAVARRIDGLHTDGHIEGQMMHASVGGSDRFVMAYRPTKKGEDAVQTVITDLVLAVVRACADGHDRDEFDGVQRYLRIYDGLVDADIDSVPAFVEAVL